MALRQIMLAKKIKQRKADLEGYLEQERGLITRSEELERAIEEATTEEEINTVEESIEALEQEKEEVASKKGTLEDEITQMESELEELNSKEPTNTPGNGGEQRQQMQQPQIVGGETRMSKRANFGMTREQRTAYVQRAEVKEFYERVRSLMAEKRAVNGAELTIPDTVLELLRDNLDGFSKLVKYVRLRPLKGTARQTIAGEIPEAIWTEACGKLNELSFDFSQIEIDGYKVGGFIPVCKATLEDSDINLANEVEYMLGEAIGYALDKAIVYGTGVKMPLGFVTRLADATPDYGPDVSTTNIKKLPVATGVELFKSVLKTLANAKSRRARNGLVLVMNEMTWNSLVLPESLSVNAAGTIVAANGGTFPVVGAKVEFLDFVPVGDIAGGYLEKYLLSERQGGFFGASEHVRWIEDEVVFKGTARYDGKPVRPDSFILFNIQNAEPTKSVAFAPDKANEATETPDGA
ncbi:phage major capsid protein [Paenibacillus sp. JNUCC31]|uniref:phage major capsid protein n=1 Tax=Paenibacillus sp. JNUCC-31 TaxID=2777983 RepID=UPI0017873C61|nr:phage major capsid protein [Paenibacillus sp. JNUCC-31]QOS77944.1 phage major capsid protein [Paenibacillus sp. JNUCC-31]QOS77987.1 phage major capsid protein [Paenibacillus sp. JNUCC-31]